MDSILHSFREFTQYLSLLHRTIEFNSCMLRKFGRKKDVRLKTAPYALLSWRCQVLQFSPAPLYVVSLYFVSRLMNKSHFLEVMRVCSNKRFKQWKDSFPHSITVPFAPLDRSIDRSYVSSMQLNDIVKHFSSLITKTIIVFRLSPFLPTQSLKLF